MKKSMREQNTAEKGVILYFMIILMMAVLGIGVGLSTLLVPELKTVRGTGQSLQALNAADTGIERLGMLDVCMDIKDEDDRNACARDVFEITTFEVIPMSCKQIWDGTPPPDDPDPDKKQECRKEAFADLIESDPTYKSNDVGGATYSLCKDAVTNCDIKDAGGDCGGIEYCVQSTGTFLQAQRAIEVVN